MSEGGYNQYVPFLSPSFCLLIFDVFSSCESIDNIFSERFWFIPRDCICWFVCHLFLCFVFFFSSCIAQFAAVRCHLSHLRAASAFLWRRLWRKVRVFYCTLRSIDVTSIFFFFPFFFVLLCHCSRPTGSHAGKVEPLAVQKPIPVDHIGGYQLALPIFAGMESKFGLFLPKFRAGSIVMPSSPSPWYFLLFLDARRFVVK